MLIILITLISIGFGIYLFRKNSRLAILLCSWPFLLLAFFMLRNFLSTTSLRNVTPEDIIGVYKIVHSDVHISTSEYSNYQIQLLENHQFIANVPSYISICPYGKYELDTSFEFNEISFLCDEKQWIPKHLRKKKKQFQIVIYTNFDTEKGIVFEKVPATN